MDDLIDNIQFVLIELDLADETPTYNALRDTVNQIKSLVYEYRWAEGVAEFTVK